MAASLSGVFNTQQFTSAGDLAEDYRLYTYIAGTTTHKSAYTEPTGVTAHTYTSDGAGGQYIATNARGELPAPLFLLAGAYDLTLKTAAGSTVWTRYAKGTDDSATTLDAALRADVASTSDAAKGDALTGVKTTLAGAVATTQHQVNEERTSAFQVMSAAQIAAISAETGAAGAECSVALQSGIDGLAQMSLPYGRYMLSTPLRIKNGTERITLKGDNRIRCILSPDAVSIATAPVSINALFIVQDNNAHFCMENVRFYSSVAYTGIGIYAKEGGGSDASGQALFSTVLRNLWVDFASTNGGFFTGALNNSVVDTMTAENMVGVFTLEGVGNGDSFYHIVSMVNCYDHFIKQTADTNGSNNTSVCGIHAYSHNRGRLIDVKNWVGANISDVILEPNTGATDTGLFRFEDCTGLQVSDFYTRTRSGVIECAVGIEIKGATSGKFSNGTIEADVGLLLSGTGAVDLEFDNVDFTNCSTASFRITAAASGTIRTRGCKFNGSQASLILSSVNSTIRWYSYEDEFLNAGFGGAGARNINWSSDNEAVFTRPRIGQNDAGALAAFYVLNSGTGQLVLVDPIWVGTPPTALTSGVVTITTAQATGFVTTTDASYTVLPADRDLIANRAGTVTYTLPAITPASVGRRLNIKTIQAQTAVSASSNVVPRAGGAAGTAILAATAGNWAELVSDGTAWQIMAGS